MSFKSSVDGSETSESVPSATLILNRRLDDIRSGSGVYLMTLLDELAAAGYSVSLVVAPITGFGSKPFSRPAPEIAKRFDAISWPGSLRIGSVFVSTRLSVWLRALHRSAVLFWWRIGARKGDRPQHLSSLSQPLRPAECTEIVEAANAFFPAVVIAEYSALAPVAARCNAEWHAVLLHDVFAFRANSFEAAGLVPDHGAVGLQTEIEWLKGADILIYASKVEACRLAELLPEKMHIWMPPQVQLREIEPSGRPRAVFIGVRHGSNIDALDFLLKEVWECVRARVTDAELWIVGEICSDLHTVPKGVRLLGVVDDLSSVGGADSVGLAPVRACSGISIKVATYLELGMSILASPKAVEGYAGQLDDIVVQATDSSEFCEKLVQLLSDRDLRIRTAQGNRKLADGRIETNALASALRNIAAGRNKATA